MRYRVVKNCGFQTHRTKVSRSFKSGDAFDSSEVPKDFLKNVTEGENPAAVPDVEPVPAPSPVPEPHPTGG